MSRTAPSAVAHYPARRRSDAEVVFFDLAREIDLLPPGRADRLTAPLRDGPIDSFGLQLRRAAAACDAGAPRADRAKP